MFHQLWPHSFTSSAISSSTNWAVAVLVAFLCFSANRFLPYSITSESAQDHDHLIFSSQRFLNMFKMQLFLYFLFLEKAPVRILPEKISCLNLGGLQPPSPPKFSIIFPNPNNDFQISRYILQLQIICSKYETPQYAENYNKYNNNKYT